MSYIDMEGRITPRGEAAFAKMLPARAAALLAELRATTEAARAGIGAAWRHPMEPPPRGQVTTMRLRADHPGLKAGDPVYPSDLEPSKPA